MRLFYYWQRLLHPFLGLGWAGFQASQGQPTSQTAEKSARETDGMRRSGLVKTEAEDLLDWLEANGCLNYEISSLSGNTFAVRWWH